MEHEPSGPILAEFPGHWPERDALTGLPGRTVLRERFEAAIVAARREGERLAILFVDLDGFEQVNDDLSHRVGDAALRHAARCLDASVRGSDTVSRHGGDEFVILLTELALPADAAHVAEKIVNSLMAPERIDRHVVSMSASIGISLYPDDGSDLEELIHQADGAMYRAKRQGPGRYMFHSAEAPARNQSLASTPSPAVSYPHAASNPWNKLRRGHLQKSNEQLLLAALAAEELQARAEHALNDQTALLARVAHELRNPLTPISLAASLIDRAEANDLPQLRAVIERQVDYIKHLVSDLLDLSRAQVGKLRLHRSIVDVRGVVAEALEACRPAMEIRRQRVVVDMPVQALPVDGDRIRLVQVLSNLLDNASKYTPAEGTVTVVARAEGTDMVLSVADTGIGMRASAIAAVFRPFVQDAHATSFDGAGLGIGLTVVRELVEAHGGRIQAFSAGIGQGSRFVLTLPLHAGDGTSAEPRKS